MPRVSMPRFYAPAGIEIPAVTAAQMREVDRIAIEETGPNLFQMMENAGRSLASLTIERLGNGWQKANIIVLAGSGGNGGGGICAARHLGNRHARVRLCLVKPERLAEVAAFQRKIFGFSRGEEVDYVSLRGQSVDLIVDALLGYGLSSAPQGAIKECIQWANQARAPIVSLDMPSGVDSTSGETPGEFIVPTWTLTLALPKTGLLNAKTGELFLADIGMPREAFKRIKVTYTSPFGSDFVIALRLHDRSAG